MGVEVLNGAQGRPVVSGLAPAEAASLAEAEAVIERGLVTFVEVGEALRRIRDSRLYRGTHGTFADYCRERWRFSRQTGYDLMQTAQVAQSVQEVGHGLPTREQARELTPLREDPEGLREAWSESVERHGEEPTAAEVREVVDKGRSRSRAAAEPVPSWAVRAEALASELRKLARGGPPNREGCRSALALLGDVEADLRRLAGEGR